MDDHTPDEALPCADARRVLLLTMRNVRSVSDRIGNLVAPWAIIGVMGLEEAPRGD